MKTKQTFSKNLSQNFSTTIAFLLLAASSAAHAQDGNGGGKEAGGGARIEQHLRDIMDSGTCIVERGQAFAEKYAPEAYEILEDLKKTHWLFASRLKIEIARLKVCPINTDPKKPRAHLDGVSTDDLDGYLYYSKGKAKKVKLVAIRERFRDNMFADMLELKQLTSHSRGLLMIHEAMHAVISWETRQRNHRVRNIVDVIDRAAKNPMSPETFKLQLAFSEVDKDLVPYTLENFSQEHAEDYERALTPEDSENDRIASPERRTAIFRTLIALSEAFGLFEHSAYSRKSHALSEHEYYATDAIQTESDEILATAFREKNWREFARLVESAPYFDLGMEFMTLKLGYSHAYSHAWSKHHWRDGFDIAAIENKDASALRLLTDLAIRHRPDAFDQSDAFWLAAQTGDKTSLRILLSNPMLNMKGEIMNCTQQPYYSDRDEIWSPIFPVIRLGDPQLLSEVLKHPSFKKQAANPKVAISLSRGLPLDYDDFKHTCWHLREYRNTETFLTPVQFAKALRHDNLVQPLLDAGLH